MGQKKVSHTWEVKTKQDGTFQEATLDGKKMKFHFVEGEDQNSEIDLEKMQEDFDNHPGPGVVKVPDPPKGPPYLYCLPLRDRNGRIIMYTCGGNGPYLCGQ